MLIRTRPNGAEAVLNILPSRLSLEIKGLCKGRREGIEALGEVRLRAGGRASLRLGGRCFSLFSSVTAEEIEEIVVRICGGAVYAHRDSISEGYLSFCDGVRVGVAGSARYEGGKLVGIENITSLVFRIPSGDCDNGEELFSAFGEVSTGMLIYSPPGGGKTTALRSLAKMLGSGKSPKRVCVIDEREEFFGESYRNCEVDILRGYKRQAGLELATRSMSPDVVIIDEIGVDDAQGIAGSVRSGIPVIATAHARSIDEVRAKISLKPLFDIGAFDVFVGIFQENGRHIIKVDKNG